jgi:hypothetical protein
VLSAHHLSAPLRRIPFPFRGSTNHTLLSFFIDETCAPVFKEVIKYAEEEPILVTKVEELESDGAGNLVTAEEIVDQVFIYDKETGEKLSWAKIGRNP